MIDTHAHLWFPDFDADRDAVLARARAAGLTGFCSVGTDVETSRAAVALAGAVAGAVAAVGIHPHEAKSVTPAALAQLSDLAHDRVVVAVGEIGLDYFRDLSPRGAQHAAFRAQLRLARDRGLPVLLHCRDAHDDLLRILREEGGGTPWRGIAHCYSGGPSRLDAYLAAGLHISFAGPVTYKNAGDVRAAATAAPADRLLLETDCPFLTPHPHRGKRNEPAYLRLTAEAVAAARAESVESVIARTSANARALLPGIG